PHRAKTQTATIIAFLSTNSPTCSSLLSLLCSFSEKRKDLSTLLELNAPVPFIYSLF
ncbi:hypothetical protein S245_063970, partial [Arachis hypogaea]